MMPAQAQQSGVDAARDALAALQAATEQMQAADRSRDRVRALTEAVRAHEDGLDAVRDGLRDVTIREAHLTAALDSREAELSQLVGMLLRIEGTAPPVQLLHPEGPVGAARAAMLLAEVTPTLKARADVLRGEVAELRRLRLVQEEAETALQAGLEAAQQARVALSQAVADRVDLPQRFANDPERMAQMAASARTLDSFAALLADLPELPGEAPQMPATGQWPLPVSGLVLRQFNEADAAGISRPGIILATRPAALVTAPVSATLRYLGPLLDLGNVVILEPAPDQMIILSGLGRVFGEVGQVLPAGNPVGMMGGENDKNAAFLSTGGEGAGSDRPETLYIEIRENGRPVDPQTWFATGEDG